jgi:2'-5' RNA ligase
VRTPEEVAQLAPYVRRVLQSSEGSIKKNVTENGVMVAIFLPPQLAGPLSRFADCPAENLHIPLCYIAEDYHDLNDRTLSALSKAVAQIASEFAPFRVVLSGTGRFARKETEDGVQKEAFYLSVSSPELLRLREALVAALEAYGVPYSTEYAYTPHVTLAYLTPGQPDPLPPLQTALPFQADELHVAVGPEQFYAPLTGGMEKRIVREDGQWCVRSEETGRSFGCYASRGEAEARLRQIESYGEQGIQAAYKVAKASPEKRYTLGPMYMPDRLDAHGEFTDADILQEGVWGYVRRGERTIYLQHSDTPAGEFVELMSWPYEASVKMVVPGDKEKTVKFPAGTVYMGVIWQPWAWELVKDGKLRGLSMGGHARRMEAEFNVAKARLPKNVPTPEVNVTTAGAGKNQQPVNVHVEVNMPGATPRRVERDRDGNVTRIVPEED